MRLARRPGARLSPAALPASPAPVAPAPAPAGGSAGGEDVQHRARRGAVLPFPPPPPPPPSQLITGHRSEDGRAARNKHSLISTAGLRRDAGRPGRGQPRGSRAALSAPHWGGTRTRHARTGEVPDSIPDGRVCSPGRTAHVPGAACGEDTLLPEDVPVTRCRLPGGQPVGGAAGRAAAAGTAAVSPFPRRRATLVQIATCHLPDGNRHPLLQKSRQPGTAASPVVHGNRRI